MKTIDDKLVEKFRTEVHEKFESDSDAILFFEDCDFRALTGGWAIAQGMSFQEASDFASYIRYETDMG